MTFCSRKTRPSKLWAVLIVCTAVSLACGSGETAPAPAPAPAPTKSEGFVQEGEILETMESGGYTYVRVRTDGGEVWAAGPETSVGVGDKVNLPSGSLMTGFESKSLGRTFDAIYFVGSIEVVSGSGATESAEVAAHGRTAAAPAEKVESVGKAEGGSTIAELYAQRAELAGKEVLVRGTVVKYTAGIMGRNWIHIQDGTGEAGSKDLTVTTRETTNVGDVILVRGTAAVDKDFGAGYRYDLIVEDAKIEK